VSNISLAKGGDKSPDPRGQMFVFDRNFSYDAGLAKSETNINRVQTPPIPDPEFLNSPRVGRLWRRMSEPVNDLPKQRIKKRKPVYVRQQNVNNNNKDFLQKVEMLHSFTEDTLNALKQEQEQGGACKTDQDSTELLKILDDTHQQFRNNLLRGVHRSRQGSISSAGNRESPAHSDIDIDSDNKPKKFEQAKKMTEMKKPPEIKKLPEIKKASEAKKITQTPSTPIEDMLFFKIDRPAEDNHESLEKDLLENDEEVHSPVASGLDLRESRSNPVLMELNQIKELEIIEEQNEQDNQSDSGECSSLLHEEVERQLDKKTT